LNLKQSCPLIRSIVVGLVSAFALARVTFAVEPAASGGASTELTTIEAILRQAGATPTELTGIEENLSSASHADLVEFVEYLQHQSAVGRAAYLADFRLNAQYVPGPDSKPQAGVLRGKTFEFTFEHSRILPGTHRKITVYVPAEYTADKPACLYVSLDELRFSTPTVFDNLIYKHEIPVTIAIGVSPGVVDSADPPHNPRFHRSSEFDGLNDDLARFLAEELLPEVERHTTPDGLPIRLSKDPNDHAISGASTGGIGAFTVAWEHPEVFRRVFTSVGTFVGMRGGDRYPVLIRKTEPKPLRIFMQDGSNDLSEDVGDWWMSNQAVERALKFAGYQVEHAWGEGSHNGNHGTLIFPDAMRWLWKDWPQPIVAGESQGEFLQAILQRGEEWRAVAGDYRSDGLLAVDPQGTVVFRDLANGKMRDLLADGQLRDSMQVVKAQAVLAFGSDGRAYARVGNDVVTYTPNGASSIVARGVCAQYLVVTHNGTFYLTDPGTDESAGKVWFVQSNGKRTLIDTGLHSPTGIALSPDGLWLAVAENKTHWGYSYRIQADGSVQDKMRFYWFYVPDIADDSGAGSWVMDREGRLYGATRMGVQVFDRNGRSRVILPLPGGEATGLTFGGSHFDTLYVSCSNHRLYSRKLKVAGFPPGGAPVALPKGAPW